MQEKSINATNSTIDASSLDGIENIPVYERLEYLKKIDTETLASAIPYIDHLSGLLEKLPEKDRLSFINTHKIYVKTLIKDGFDLSRILSLLPQDSIEPFINNTLEVKYVKRIFSVSASFSLDRVLKTLPETLRLTFIMKMLGIDYVLNLTKESSKMGSVLTQLPEKERVSFILQNVNTEYLEFIIKNTSSLIDILQALPEDARWGFILEKLTQIHLERLINSKDDLNSILKKLPENQRLRFIEQHLNPIHLRRIIKKIYDLRLILESLSETDKSLFIQNTLEMTHIAFLIDNIDDWVAVLKNLPKIDRLPFIKKFTINKIITFMSTFHSSYTPTNVKLKSLFEILPQTDHQAFLEHIIGNTEFIRVGFVDTNDLLAILEKIPQAQRCDFMLTKLNIKSMNYLIKDYSCLERILGSLDEESTLLFIQEALGKYCLKEITNNHETLLKILKILPDNLRMPLIKKQLDYDKDHVKTLINTQPALLAILQALPEKSRLSFIKDTFDLKDIKSIIKNEDERNGLLNILPHDKAKWLFIITLDMQKRALISAGILALVFIGIAITTVIPVVGPFLAGLFVTASSAATPFIVGAVGASIAAGVLLIGNVILAARSWIKSRKSISGFNPINDQTNNATSDISSNNVYGGSGDVLQNKTGKEPTKPQPTESGTSLNLFSIKENTGEKKEDNKQSYTKKN